MKDELKIKILKREEDRILIEVKFRSKIYNGYIEVNSKSSERIKGIKSKRKLICNKAKKRIEKQIFKATDAEIVQALKSSLIIHSFSSDISNTKLESEIFKSLVGRTVNTRGRHNSIHKDLPTHNRLTFKLTESETGGTLPPIQP